MANQQFVGNWNYPTSIKFGAGRLAQLPLFCANYKMKHPLLVTDQGLVNLPVFAKVTDVLKQASVTFATYSQIKPNPTGTNVDQGLAYYNQQKCDGVIAFGGGSALDAAKAIALTVGQKHSLWDFEDVGDNWTRVNVDTIPPVIAIPTTAGTGSEVGRASVITHEKEKRKVIIFHPRMLPPLVLADPELTFGLPKPVTAATGMDALSHSLEAYCAPGFHPMADGIAVEAMRLVKNNLSRAYNDPQNVEARSNMLVASAMGATAFQKGLGAIHALAHPLGAHYDAPHGLLNAILMPYVVEANAKVIEDKMQHLARCLDLPGRGVDPVLKWIYDLRDAVAIPNTLRGINIDADQAELIGDLAVGDPSAGGNPISFNAKQYAEIFRKAVNGG